MAGPVANIWKKKPFKYSSPAPPANLIDCSNLTIDFTTRKFLNIGLDPTDEFNTKIHIITASRHVNIPVDFLQRIFRLMGNILSFILDQPVKYKRNLFLETDSISLASMVYQSENTLVIESKIEDGCRVLLNRSDLLQLQDLECAIFEIIGRKSNIIKPIVLHHIDLIATFLKINVPIQNSTLEIMRSRVRNIDNSYIQRHVIDEAIQYGISQGDYIYTNQVKLYATDTIVQKWMEKLEKDEGYNRECSIAISPPSFSSLYEQGNLPLISPLAPSAQESLVENKQHSLSWRLILELKNVQIGDNYWYNLTFRIFLKTCDRVDLKYLDLHNKLGPETKKNQDNVLSQLGIEIDDAKISGLYNDRAYTFGDEYIPERVRDRLSTEEETW